MVCLEKHPTDLSQTERTHEENQERAYIAASRRSDRSLEARVESARRASEIHKRRTGRSLRVTEQDVQNEEMYEEEDDDLPLQYRRLTAHLQTGSADFNRRLSAYLTNHVAMRSALEQSIHQSYAQQFPNAQQYQQGMFPSPMMGHQQQQSGMMQPPHQNYRQHPYSSPQQQQQGFTLSHQRANSVANPQQSQMSTPSSPAITNDQRRSMSMSIPPSDSLTPSTDPRSPVTPGSGQQIKPSFPPGSFTQNQQAQQQFALPSYDQGAFGQTNFPFSMQLPGESQGFLNNTLNPNDPLTNMMMAGSDSSMLWNFNQNQQFNMSASNMNASKLQEQQYVGGPQHAPSVAGLNSTLAPPSSMEQSKPASHVKVDRINLDDEVSPTAIDSDDAKFGDDGVDNNVGSDLFFENAMMNKDGTTPGLNGDSWDSWINDNSWSDVPAPSQ